MMVDISAPDAPHFLRLIKLGNTVRSVAAVDMVTVRLTASVNRPSRPVRHCEPVRRVPAPAGR